MGKIVGIDLGTTNSLVAYLDPQTKHPKCIVGPHGSTLCPSVVSLDPDGNIIVGEPARRRLITQPERTIYSVKRLMGRGVRDIQDELKLFPFRLDPSSSNVIRVRLGEKVFTPPEISAFILRELKNWAEAFFGEAVERAVITVPAYFNDAQRQASKDANFHGRRRHLSGAFHQWRYAPGWRRYRQPPAGFRARKDFADG